MAVVSRTEARGERHVYPERFDGEEMFAAREPLGRKREAVFRSTMVGGELIGGKLGDVVEHHAVRRVRDVRRDCCRAYDRFGILPLHRAVIRGSADVVTLLLDRGADIHAIHGAGGRSFEGYAPQDKQPNPDPNYPTVDGVTLLHELCHKDTRGRTMDHRTESAEILLEFGADPSPKDSTARRP